MPTFVLRKIPAGAWRKFRDRADARGWPYRWVLLEMIDAFAEGRVLPAPEKPVSERTDAPKAVGPTWEI